MTIFFSPYPKFFLSGIRASASFQGRISFLKPFLNVLRFSIFVCLQMFLNLFPSLHAFSPSLAHSQSRTQPSTHNSSVHSLVHATRAVGLLALPTGEGEGGGGAPLGCLVGGDEPGSSALSPDIHNGFIHTHV